MQITIHGPVKVGPSWEQLNNLLRSMLGEGRLTRIARRDGQANYRATAGRYDLTFTPDQGDTTAIVLDLNVPESIQRAELVQLVG